MSTAETDGRLARSQRTRAAIVDALIALLRDGEHSPNAQQIADRAGISKRSIFVHYSSLEDLFGDVAKRGAELVIGLLWVIDPALPLPERIDAICRQRSQVNEEIGPLRRAGAARASASSTAAETQRFARSASRDQIARVFAAELADLERRDRRLLEAAIDAAVCGETWDFWRTSHGLSIADARETMRTTLRALLHDTTPPPAS